ncbi:MAG: hypothetical protein WA631_07475 [Nitrososphaeraceae archaeon]
MIAINDNNNFINFLSKYGGDKHSSYDRKWRELGFHVICRCSRGHSRDMEVIQRK